MVRTRQTTVETQETVMSDLAERGEYLYQNTLKPLLEPAQNGSMVAIHPDSGDYSIARSSGDAMRAMHDIYPNGKLYLRKIGSEPEYGLAARIIAGEMRSEMPK